MFRILGCLSSPLILLLLLLLLPETHQGSAFNLQLLRPELYECHRGRY
jgi:hypothetical protein